MTAMSAVAPTIPSAIHDASPAEVSRGLKFDVAVVGPNPPATTAAASRSTATIRNDVERLMGPLDSPRSVRYQCPSRSPSTTAPRKAAPASNCRRETTDNAPATRSDHSPAWLPSTRPAPADPHAPTATTRTTHPVSLKNPVLTSCHSGVRNRSATPPAASSPRTSAVTPAGPFKRVRSCRAPAYPRPGRDPALLPHHPGLPPMTPAGRTHGHRLGCLADGRLALLRWRRRDLRAHQRAPVGSAGRRPGRPGQTAAWRPRPRRRYRNGRRRVRGRRAPGAPGGGGGGRRVAGDAGPGGTVPTIGSPGRRGGHRPPLP